MKEFEITIEGKAYKVKVEQFGGTHASVVVDGKKYEVDVSGMDLRMPPLSFARKPYTQRPGMNTTPTPSPSTPAPATPPPGAKPVVFTGGEGTITAPMPGLILEVMVQVGDRVEQGAMVVKMEAMKMENEIPAPVGGIVKNVAVKKGDSVATGEILLEIG
jgi:biotin carboxyl carrier protein